MRKSIKQLLLVISLVSGVWLSSNAQEFGVRFGGTNGAGGVAVDGIFSTGQFNRIHADLGFYSGGIGIDAVWDFLYKPITNSDLNWYLGVGPSTYLGNEFWLGASGEIGAEYKFPTVPIAIGIDWRPTIWLVKETKFGADSFGLNIRYVFGK
ncbi:MAG TPA: hypothetical protein P5210_07730 [Draconibacterium sp.]|nr:hypothetical protein [Draconibacterium sp.]